MGVADDILATESVSGAGMGMPGLPSGELRTPMQMMCDIPCLEKGIHWICWLYSGLYWLVVELPNWLVDTLGWFGWIVTAYLVIVVIGIIIAICLLLTEVSAALTPLEILHREPMFRAVLYIGIGMLMLGHHVGPLPWVLVALLVGIIAFFDGIGILSSGIFTIFPVHMAGLSFWIGISWAIVMVLLASVQFGMLVPFTFALLALGPMFGLPWQWFEDTFSIFLGLSLVVFIILCFYPQVVPGFETILRLFDYILRTFHFYDMPC